MNWNLEEELRQKEQLDWNKVEINDIHSQSKLKLISNYLNQAHNKFDEEQLKKQLSPYHSIWWIELQQILNKAKTFNKNHIRGVIVYDFDSWVSYHSLLFPQYIFKGLTTELKQYKAYTWINKNKLRKQFINEILKTASVYNGCIEQENYIYEFCILFYYWLAIRTSKIFFKYNYQMMIIILIQILSKYNALSKLSMILKNESIFQLDKENSIIDEVIRFLKIERI